METMKAIQFTAPNTAEFNDVPMPAMEDHEVLVRVHYVGVCGTDIELYTGDMNYIKRGLTTYPLIPGHEWAGEVVKIGPNTKGVEIGDRVTGDVSLGCGNCKMCKEGRYNLCPDRGVIGSYKNRDGAFAEYIRVPFKNIYKLPKNVSMKEGALVECAATSAYAVMKSRIKYGDTVLIFGDGPIANLALQAAFANGASRGFVIGSWEEKLELAREIGAEATFSYKKDDVVAEIQKITGGQGVDIIFECSGSTTAVNQSIELISPGGKIVLLSWYDPQEFVTAVNMVVAKDAEIIGVLASPNAFAPTIAQMSRGAIKSEQLITQIYPLEQAEDAIKMIMAKKEYRMKVLLEI